MSSKAVEENVKKLVKLGYSKSKSQKALKECRNDLNQAKALLHRSRQEEMKKICELETVGRNQIEQEEAALRKAAEPQEIKVLHQAIREEKANAKIRRHPCIAQYGTCRYGERCSFRHLPANICMPYIQGSCIYGEMCRNSHSIDGKDVRKIMHESLDYDPSVEYLPDPKDPENGVLEIRRTGGAVISGSGTLGGGAGAVSGPMTGGEVITQRLQRYRPEEEEDEDEEETEGEEDDDDEEEEESYEVHDEEVDTTEEYFDETTGETIVVPRKVIRKKTVLILRKKPKRGEGGGDQQAKPRRRRRKLNTRNNNTIPEPSMFNPVAQSAPSYSDPVVGTSSDMWTVTSGGPTSGSTQQQQLTTEEKLRSDTAPKPFLERAKAAPSPSANVNVVVKHAISSNTRPLEKEKVPRHPCVVQCGRCKYGKSCNHYNLPGDVCVHWLNGRCAHGDSCYYKHSYGEAKGTTADGENRTGSDNRHKDAAILNAMMAGKVGGAEPSSSSSTRSPPQMSSDVPPPPPPLSPPSYFHHSEPQQQQPQIVFKKGTHLGSSASASVSSMPASPTTPFHHHGGPATTSPMMLGHHHHHHHPPPPPEYRAGSTGAQGLPPPAQQQQHQRGQGGQGGGGSSSTSTTPGSIWEPAASSSSPSTWEDLYAPPPRAGTNNSASASLFSSSQAHTGSNNRKNRLQGVNGGGGSSSRRAPDGFSQATKKIENAPTIAEAEEQRAAFRNLYQVFPMEPPDAILIALERFNYDQKKAADWIVASHDSVAVAEHIRIMDQQQREEEEKDDAKLAAKEQRTEALVCLCDLFPHLEPQLLGLMYDKAKGNFDQAVQDIYCTHEYHRLKEINNAWNENEANAKRKGNGEEEKTQQNQMRIDRLQGMFPQMDRRILTDVLKGSGFTMPKAIEILNQIATDEKDLEEREADGRKAVTASLQERSSTTAVVLAGIGLDDDDDGFDAQTAAERKYIIGEAHRQDTQRSETETLETEGGRKIVIRSGNSAPAFSLLSESDLYSQTLHQLRQTVDWRRVRQEAYLQNIARVQMVSLAVRAYSRQDHATGKALMKRAREVRHEYERLNMIAMHALEQEQDRVNGTGGIVDLHGFHVNEAIDVVDRRVRTCVRKQISRLRVVVGSGRNSKVQGKSVVYPQIVEHLKHLESKGLCRITSLKQAEIQVWIDFGNNVR